MKLADKQKKELKGIFSSNPKLEAVFINDRGEYFTSRNRAELSDSSGDRLIEVKRSAIPTHGKGDAETDAPKPVPLVLELVDGRKLTFPEITGDGKPKEGDKAKEGRKNADGEYADADGTTYTFVKGRLEGISEPEAIPKK